MDNHQRVHRVKVMPALLGSVCLVLACSRY